MLIDIWASSVSTRAVTQDWLTYLCSRDVLPPCSEPKFNGCRCCCVGKPEELLLPPKWRVRRLLGTSIWSNGFTCRRTEFRGTGPGADTLQSSISALEFGQVFLSLFQVMKRNAS